jgi:hypothetical protein
MKRFVVIAGFVSLVAFALPAAAQQMTVNGCTKQGVERGCLVLEAMPGPATYSLHSSRPLPQIGRAVTVTGTVGGLDTCLQGAVMNVSSWHYVKKSDPLCRQKKQ